MVTAGCRLLRSEFGSIIEKGFLMREDQTMHSSLEQAISRAAALPEDQQQVLASILLEEMASESRWQQAFASSQDVLKRLAEEALEEDRRGETRDLDEIL
jgi:cell division inhibitor SulA